MIVEGFGSAEIGDVVVRVPGSSANLGPGFDVLGLALGIYLEVSASPSERFEVEASGEGANLRAASDHLGAQVARRVLGHDRVKLRIRSQIPLSRGLGSSAAFVLGVARALGSSNPLEVAVEFEGHPENAAASFYGGLIAAGVIGSSTVVERLRIDPSLAAVLVVPDVELSTSAARKTLEGSLSRSDAVFNLQRAVLLSHAMADITHLSRDLFDDRLHQLQRSSLFPEAVEIIDVLYHCGVIGACWSGAGSTMIGLASKDDIVGIVDEASGHLDRLRISATVMGADFDMLGMQVDSKS